MTETAGGDGASDRSHWPVRRITLQEEGDPAVARRAKSSAGGAHLRMTDRQPHAGVPADDVLGPLCEAFADYPVMMRYVLGAEGDYRERLRTLVGFFLTARVVRKDPILATYDGDEVSGVAICTLPGLPDPPDLDEAREWTWARLGSDARARYDQWIHIWGPLNAAEPNIHVNMLGVPPRYQGRGLGRMLLERVHAMSREHPDSRGVSLTTESAGNVPFYERLGYRIVGHGRIGPGLESWGFFRPD